MKCRFGFQDGKAIRIDQKEKVLELIDHLRTTNTAASANIDLNLDDAANIVNNFENPEIPDVKKNHGYLCLRRIIDQKLLYEFDDRSGRGLRNFFSIL